MHPRAVAHRGWTEQHLENTAAAIRAAIEHGCRAVEFDTRRTADGEWVVYHDADLERLHHVPLVLKEHPLAALLGHAPLDRLADVLPSFHAECLPMVEIKEIEPPGIAELAELLEEFARRVPLVAISRSRRVTELLRRHAPHAGIYVYARDWRTAEQYIGAKEIAGFDLEAAGCDDPASAPERLQRLQQGGKCVALWTVNDPAQFRRWIEAGAAWVITDFPWRMA